MPGESPGLRPLTISERGISTIYGMIPGGVTLILLRAVFTVLSGPDLSVWQFVLYASGLGGRQDVHIPIIDTYYVPYVMAHGMYAVFYFTYGRSLGHMVVNAHIVHAKTGRRMRTWQKVVRSGLQLVNGYPGFFRILDVLSALMALIDRERRRSIYDLMAGTVVVVGEPVEEEPEPVRERRRTASLLGRLTGQQEAG